MKILAVECSATPASVAIIDGEKLVAQAFANVKLTHSQTLMPMIENILAASKINLNDIEGFAISNGPGSFTGVRIGVATIKGLALGRNKPCVGVSTIEALYENLSDYEGIICPIMNARRGQVYTGAFLDGKRILNDTCMMLDDLIPMLEKYDKPIHFNGDGYELVLDKKIANFRHTPEALKYQSAYSVGKVAYNKIKSSEYVSDIDLRVEYLRKAQAEREREERLGGQSNG